MVSFGIAPAVLVYLAVLKPLGNIGIIISVVFSLCGAVRLARYNLDESALGHVTFEGIPIPIAAGYIWSFVMVRHSLPQMLVACGVVLMAVCMVSTLKVPKFRRGDLPFWLMFLGLAFFIVFLAHPVALTWHIWNGWNVVLVVINYIFLQRRGLLGKGAAPVPSA